MSVRLTINWAETTHPLSDTRFSSRIFKFSPSREIAEEIRDDNRALRQGRRAGQPGRFKPIREPSYNVRVGTKVIANARLPVRRKVVREEIAATIAKARPTANSKVEPAHKNRVHRRISRRMNRRRTIGTDSQPITTIGDANQSAGRGWNTAAWMTPRGLKQQSWMSSMIVAGSSAAASGCRL